MTRLKKGLIVGTFAVLLLFVVFYAVLARRSEIMVVKAVSDFYVVLLKDEAANLDDLKKLGTKRFALLLDSEDTMVTATCGFSLPEEIRVGNSMAFFGDALAVVEFTETDSFRFATVFLEKLNGVWLVDAISCERKEVGKLGSSLNTNEETGGSWVWIYAYDSEKDKDEQGNIMCSKNGLVALRRYVPQSIFGDKSFFVLNELIMKPLTANDRARGLTSEFPLEGVELISSKVENGVLTLEINDPLSRTSGGACRAGILRAQIEETAKKIGDDVVQVVITPEDLFQP